MYSAAKDKSPNTAVCFISSKMRSQKNRTIQYLDAVTEDQREKVSKEAVALGQGKEREGE